MEQFTKIHYYQARRRNVLDILEEQKRPLLLQELKELYKKKYVQNMPFSEEGDVNIENWLSTIENIDSDLKNNQRCYFVKNFVPENVSKTISGDNNKRKTSSPIVSQTIKRSRSAPDNEDQTPQSSNMNRNAGNRQGRSVKFRDTPYTKDNMKTRSKSENRPSKLLGAPNLYGCLFIGDDFLLGLAVYKLGFTATKIKGKLQSGFCASGMSISDAVRKVKEIEDDRHKSALIYVGSLDIAEGRELIHMIQDMTDLMKACAERNIRPILCTLASLPNYFVGNRNETLVGYNKFISTNPFGIPVIDVNKCFKSAGASGFHPHYYVDMARYVSGSSKMLVLWSKDGRERVYDMIMKNLGLAFVSTETTVLDYI